jgi:hypothetical protein
MTPCDSKGIPLGEDAITPDPQELLGQVMYLKTIVYGVEGLEPKYRDAQRIKVGFNDLFSGEYVESPDAGGHVDDLQFEHWMVTPVDEKVLKVLSSSSLAFSVMYYQDDGISPMLNMKASSDEGGSGAAAQVGSGSSKSVGGGAVKGDA